MSQFFQLKMQRDHLQQIHFLHNGHGSFPKKLCEFVTDMFRFSSSHLKKKQNMAHKMHSRLSLLSPQNHISATAQIQLPEAKQPILSKHVLAVPTTGCT